VFEEGRGEKKNERVDKLKMREWVAG